MTAEVPTTSGTTTVVPLNATIDCPGGAVMLNGVFSVT